MNATLFGQAWTRFHIVSIGWTSRYAETWCFQDFEHALCEVHEDAHSTFEEMDVHVVLVFLIWLLALVALIFVDVYVKLNEVLPQELLNDFVFYVAVSDQIISKCVLINATSALHSEIFRNQLPFLNRINQMMILQYQVFWIFRKWG